jgi:hypothetical protein
VAGGEAGVLAVVDTRREMMSFMMRRDMEVDEVVLGEDGADPDRQMN